MIRSTTLVCLAVLLPLLVCASYGRNDDYGSGSSATKVKANKAEPVVHVGGNAAEGADVQQWDAGTARVVAQDFDAYDTFAAVVQYTAQLFVNSVEGTFHAITRAMEFIDETFAITRRLLRTWSVLSGWFGAIARAVLSTLSSMKHAVQCVFSALGDLFSAMDRWLEDYVFRVVRDVMWQVYRWAFCMRLRSLLDLVTNAASFVFDVITMRVWHPFWHWLLRVAARAPCVAGTVADVIRAPLEDVAAKSGAAVSRVLLRGGAELHMLRDGHSGGTDEPLYVPATQIAMPSGPNRQRETLADWVKYDSWIAEEPANQPHAPLEYASRVSAWTRVRVQTAFVSSASLQHDSPLQLELQTLSQTVVAGDPRRQFLLSGPQGSFGYIERSVTTHLAPFHRATSKREWLRLAAKQEPHASSEPSGALPHVLVIEVPLASKVPSVPLYTWLVPVLLALWVEAARLNTIASFIVKLLLTAFMWQVASPHLSSTVLGVWILLAVTRRGYTFAKWASFLVLIVTGFLYEVTGGWQHGGPRRHGGSERGWPGLFTAGTSIAVFLAVERQVSKRRHRFQWKLQECTRAIAPAVISFACVAAIVVVAFSLWNAVAAAHPSTVAVERGTSHSVVKPNVDDAFMAETVVANHFQCRLDLQRPITTTWTLFESIDGDAPSADDLGRAAEKMRAVKATLRAVSPPLPSGGGSTTDGNAACATLTDRQVDTLFTSIVCLFCACWALLRRSR
jgi:hypothetical protein